MLLPFWKLEGRRVKARKDLMAVFHSVSSFSERQSILLTGQREKSRRNWSLAFRKLNNLEADFSLLVNVSKESDLQSKHNCCHALGCAPAKFMSADAKVSRCHMLQCCKLTCLSKRARLTKSRFALRTLSLCCQSRPKNIAHAHQHVASAHSNQI